MYLVPLPVKTGAPSCFSNRPRLVCNQLDVRIGWFLLRATTKNHRTQRTHHQSFHFTSLDPWRYAMCEPFMLL